jgi:hypothetical protein
MTQPRIHRLFTVVPPQGRDGCRLEKLSLPAIVCIIVIVLCRCSSCRASAERRLQVSGEL